MTPPMQPTAPVKKSFGASLGCGSPADDAIAARVACRCAHVPQWRYNSGGVPLLFLYCPFIAPLLSPDLMA